MTERTISHGVKVCALGLPETISEVISLDEAAGVYKFELQRWSAWSEALWKAFDADLTFGVALDNCTESPFRIKSVTTYRDRCVFELYRAPVGEKL